MQEPSFLPETLKSYALLNADKELFLALIRHPNDLLLFFSSACEDEIWCNQHPIFIRSVIRWGAKQFYLGRLPFYEAKRLNSVIQTYYSFLQPFLYFQPALFFTIKLEIEHQTLLVNSLQFGVSSRFFYDSFKRCFDELKDRWVLTGMSLVIFHLIEEYIIKGEISDLWKQEYEELLILMRQAKTWNLGGLVKECAQILKRYINRENVVETLLQAHKHFFMEWKEESSNFFNQQNYRLLLLPIENDADLRIEILDFKQDTLDLFNRLAPWITHLAFSGNLSKDRLYSHVINSCPKLIGIDLSGSLTSDNQFNYAPSTLVELNLSSCSWIHPYHLQEASRKFINLKKLKLDGNVHLNYQAWGELSRFRQLISLSLARCHQVVDEDLKLISRSCSHLIELNLDECRSITDRGISDLIFTCPQLRLLSLNYCDKLTDKTLVELGVRAYQLTQLSLVRCTELTDKGLFQFIRLRSTLNELNIRSCNFSLHLIEQIYKEFPFLKIIY